MSSKTRQLANSIEQRQPTSQDLQERRRHLEAKFDQLYKESFQISATLTEAMRAAGSVKLAEGYMQIISQVEAKIRCCLDMSRIGSKVRTKKYVDQENNRLDAEFVNVELFRLLSQRTIEKLQQDRLLRQIQETKFDQIKAQINQMYRDDREQFDRRQAQFEQHKERFDKRAAVFEALEDFNLNVALIIELLNDVCELQRDELTSL